MDLPPEKEKEVTALVAKVAGVEVEGRTVVVSPAYISEAAALVFELVGRFSQQLADHYGGPVVPTAR